jgi:hypothetical protein
MENLPLFRYEEYLDFVTEFIERLSRYCLARLLPQRLMISLLRLIGEKQAGDIAGY